MNKKLLYTLLGIIVIAGITAYLQGNRSDKKDDAKGKTIISEGLYGDSIDSILFKTGSAEFSAQKSDNYWIVEQLNFPADTAKLFKLLNQLNTEKIVETVTDNKDSYEKFGFYQQGKQTKTQVTFSNEGKVITEILIGNSREGGGQYIKGSDTDGIWLITDTLSVPENEEELIEKNILTLKPEDITRLEFIKKRRKTVYEAVQSDMSGDVDGDRFILKSGRMKMDNNQIDAIIGIFNPLNFESLKDKLSAQNKKLGKIIGSLKLSIKSGGTLEAKIYTVKIDKKNIYAMVLRFNELKDSVLGKKAKYAEGKVFEITEGNAKTMLFEQK